jgi:hypothetical protein
VDKVDVELGFGYGFTPEADGLTIKAIIGYSFSGKLADYTISHGHSVATSTERLEPKIEYVGYGRGAK